MIQTDGENLGREKNAGSAEVDLDCSQVSSVHWTPVKNRYLRWSMIMIIFLKFMIITKYDHYDLIEHIWYMALKSILFIGLQSRTGTYHNYDIDDHCAKLAQVWAKVVVLANGEWYWKQLLIYRFFRIYGIYRFIDWWY